MKRHIPNLLTLCNALCGCVGLIWIEKNILVSSTLVFVAMIFDFADGFVARLLNVKSEIGKQLDSLADAITFGVLPAMLARQLLLRHNHFTENDWITYLPMLIALFSVFRLAKFNVDTRQTDRFIGVPTPANAMLWASFPLILHFQPEIWGFQTQIFANSLFLLILVLIMSLLLVAEIPLLALKFKHFRLKGNELRYIFLGVSVVLIILLQFVAVPFIIFSYILLSFFENTSPKN
ncbi:CDP-diacylglycerol--serine O-phosphatidyltransferase [Raineya orbicola]|jgi:CDP-diacylglycerol--serine O-phosphatidyltransferase|uniref:CDP-diacylglycerol--serine O-phosphatidyltransferase n=1 Tax=Raineya orbicola TaxID=2016530 RepID=A0A2N3I4Q8_9BACT|nr:CDP-diacylglycerol--serine O-phosphatidyltransferase [Raineya orbicola]PKQ65294.1 pssA: CDP-diacylglycerol-serine O-phosphatidyltransferase [Raineya orbicola]